MKEIIEPVITRSGDEHQAITGSNVSPESSTKLSSQLMKSMNELRQSKTGNGMEIKDPDISLILPLPPNRANARVHHFVAYKEKEEYFERCQAEIWMRQREEAKKWKPLSRAIYEVLVITKKLYDNDNLVALLKWPQDYLQKMGLIETDGPEFLWPRRFPYQIRSGRAMFLPGIYYRLWKTSQKELEILRKCEWSKTIYQIKTDENLK